MVPVADGPRPASPGTASFEDVLQELRRAGVPTLIVEAPGPNGAAPETTATSTGRVHVLVRELIDERAARSIFTTGAWWTRLGELDGWGRVPSVTYVWPSGPVVGLHRGVPVRPLPDRFVRRCLDVLWPPSVATRDVVAVADATSTCVFLAVQAARPGAQRAARLEAFVHAFERAGRDEVFALAGRAGVGRAVGWAIRAAEGRAQGRPSLSDGMTARVAWAAALRVRSSIRSPQRRARFSADPSIGLAPSRTRFAGIEVDGGPSVFVPRRMSEPLVDATGDALPAGLDAVAVDVGTGSGAVALAVARRAPHASIHGVDTSREAVEWARRNATRLGISNVRFHEGSLLEPLSRELAGRVHAIVSSVPYVRPGRWGELDRYGAVEGTGTDGLDLVRGLAREARNILVPGGRLVLQLGADQWSQFSRELEAMGYRAGGVITPGEIDVHVWVEAPA
jgi:release factor glutamine methyltransferase